MAGKAEHYVPKMLNDLIVSGNMWLKKNTDMTNFLTNKEPGVDYNLALASIQIEVKNTDKNGVLTDKPSEVQIKFLDSYGGFIFLVMWDKDYPRLPDGADAYLVPWNEYKIFMLLTNKKGKGIRRHATIRSYGADEYLQNYLLEWNKGTWLIPKENPFWDVMNKKSIDLLTFLKEVNRND